MSLVTAALVAAAVLVPAGPPREVTFAVPVPVVGERCVEKASTTITIKGKREFVQAFGERGGSEDSKETEVLAMKDGRITKARLAHTVASEYRIRDAGKSERKKATHGRAYILTRVDDAGHFTAVREDGSAINEEERHYLRDDLDQTEPPLLAGRTMKLKEKIHFDAAETARLFGFAASPGMEARDLEMSLGAIEKEGAAARVDLKARFAVFGERGEAEAVAWMTVHADLSLMHERVAIEGPVKIAMPAPAEGIGPPGAPARGAPTFLDAIVHMEAQRDCEPPTESSRAPAADAAAESPAAASPRPASAADVDAPSEAPALPQVPRRPRKG